MCDIDLKRSDLLQFAKMCAPEYNMPQLSDRVLVFDVMRDDWESATILKSISAGERDESASTEEKLVEKLEDPAQSQEGEEKSQNADESPAETLKNENECKSPEGKACEQDKKSTKADSPTTALSQASEARAPIPSQKPEDLDEPLRQHKIYVHSFWLSIQSAYFRSLFYTSGMKESRDEEVHVKVAESYENAHLTLLEATYNNDVLNEKSVDELLLVLELANKYDLKFVFKKCKYVLQKNATTFEISTEIMHMIKVKHSMEDVEDLAATLQLVLVKEFSPLDNNWQSEKFTNLSEPSLKYLLSSDDLIVQSENTVFHVLMYWMEENEVDPGSLEETNDLLAVVRFNLVTIDYLYNVIKNHPIVTKMPKFSELFLDGIIYHALPAEQKALLEKQPALRKKPTEDIVQRTFVVDNAMYQTALNTGAYNSPEEFWACGYKMSVGLTCDGYNICPQLNIHNLNKESLVFLNFSLHASSRHASLMGQTFNMSSHSKQYSLRTFPLSHFNNNNEEILHVVIAPR